jgi:hypothetical protein
MKYIIIIASSLCFNVIFAQGEKVVILDKGSSKKEQRMNNDSGELKGFDNKYAVKFTPTQMIIGEINFSFERAVGNRLSVELEAGPTLSRIGLFSLNYFGNNSGSNVSKYSDLGGFVVLGLRFYPLMRRYNLNGLYVGPAIKYRHYNTELKDNFNGLANTTDKRTDLNFTFNIGYQVWASKMLCFDFYGGFGLNYRMETSNQIVSVYDPVTTLYNSEWQREKDKGVLFLGRLGVKIGIGG